MPQDIPLPPSAAELAEAATGPASEREREYYTDMPCAEGQGCGGEGIVIPHDRRFAMLDREFGLEDPQSLPASDEVLPVIFDHALMTKEGVIDAFARHYPLRAARLFELLAKEGFVIDYVDAHAQLGPLLNDQAVAQSGAELARDRMEGMSPQGTGPGGMPRSGVNSQQDAIDYALAVENRNRNQDRSFDLNRRIGDLGEWRITGQRIRITNIIDSDYQRGAALFESPLGEDDDSWNLLPTNIEGAARLNDLVGLYIAQYGPPITDADGNVIDSGAEGGRAQTLRHLSAAGLIVLGILEAAGGVVAIGGAGLTGGASAVAGVALTVTGADAFTQGFQKLFSANIATGRSGFVGDLAYYGGYAFGGDETGQRFERGWSMLALAAGLGGGVTLLHASTRVGTVSRATSSNVPPVTRGQLDEAVLRLPKVEGMPIGNGVKLDYVALPSQRGALVDIHGAGRMWVPPQDSELRWLLGTHVRGQARMVDEFAAAAKMQSPVRITSEASAREFLELVARSHGVRLDDLVNIVTVDRKPNPFFLPGPDGQRVLNLPSGMSAQSTYMQYMWASHEINHARLFQKLVERHGYSRAYQIDRQNVRVVDLYNREERLVQRAAEFQMRYNFEESLSVEDITEFAAALRWSREYLDRHR